MLPWAFALPYRQSAYALTTPQDSYIFLAMEMRICIDRYNYRQRSAILAFLAIERLYAND